MVAKYIDDYEAGRKIQCEEDVNRLQRYTERSVSGQMLRQWSIEREIVDLLANTKKYIT